MTYYTHLENGYVDSIIFYRVSGDLNSIRTVLMTTVEEQSSHTNTYIVYINVIYKFYICIK